MTLSLPDAISADPQADPPQTAVPDEHPSSDSVQLPAPSRRRLPVALLSSIVLVGGAAGLGVWCGFIPSPLYGSPAPADVAHSSAQSDEDDLTTIPTVKVVRPKRESTAEIVLERIATVEPYFRADLRARASGIVKAVMHDIGEVVKRGDVLIEIDVAEYEKDVAQKLGLIVQRQQELKVSQSKFKEAQSARQVAVAAILQKEAEVQAVTATRDLKKSRYARYKELADRGTVVGHAVLEEERDYKASEGALKAAEANVARAKADEAEADAAIEAAGADVELKRAQVEVAKLDLDRAKVIANYGKVIAPFDGVVVRRNVDPGSFVQNATTGSSETLISVSRIDLLTVVAQFPDNAAPYIAEGTPAVIQIADLAGAAIFSKVTRFSPTIQNSDRTMRVEVDLFNGDSVERQKLEDWYRVNHTTPQLKGNSNILPPAAFAVQQHSKRQLLPGMNGSVKLAFGGSGQSYVLPSTAVYSRSGASYILIVADNKTRQIPVRVQLNDGQKMRVSTVKRQTRSDGTVHETLTGLRGDEAVVVTSQLQIGEDVQVRASPTDW